jgi:hypothetical protein
MIKERQVLRPFRQGDLDGMCGIYAVVNAVRAAAAPYRHLPRSACLELFVELCKVRGRRDLLRAAVMDGLVPNEVGQLLDRAQVGFFAPTACGSRSNARSPAVNRLARWALCGSSSISRVSGPWRSSRRGLIGA